MPASRTVFEILRVQQDPAADAALLAALEGADSVTAHAVVDTLLARSTPEGLLGLVQLFHTLDEDLRQVLLIEWERLFSVLREAGQSRTDQVRVNVLDIIRRACIYRASYLVEGGLRHRSPNVRQAATDALCFLADELLRTAPVPVRDSDLQQISPQQIRDRMQDLNAYAEDRRQVVSAVEAALGSFEIHHQPRVVEIALWFLDEMGPTFWSILTVPGSRVAQSAIQHLHKSPSPRLVPFMMTAMNFSEFRPHIAKALADGADPLFLEEWLRQSWRLTQPKMGRAMMALKELACTDRHGNELLQLPPRSQRHLARWIVCTGLGQREKIELLKDVLHGASLPTRRSVLWMLTTLDDSRVNEVLEHVEDAEDPELAVIARRELAIRCPGEIPISRLMPAVQSDWDQLDLQTEHQRPVSSADKAEPITFDRYWSRFDGMAEQERLSLGRQVLENTPMAHSVLAGRLGCEELLDRVRAVRIIACLDLAEQFQEKLYQLCHDPRPQMRSAVVAALAPLDNAVSRRLLHRALDDQDSRVQANAVEAVAASGRESIADELMSKLSSPDNRVQANAVKALLRLGVREAAETLLKMLSHESRLHRISALWLIERMGLFTLASRVTGMAGNDPDPFVRQRAIAIAQCLPLAKDDARAPGPDGSLLAVTKPARVPAEVMAP